MEFSTYETNTDDDFPASEAVSKPAKVKKVPIKKLVEAHLPQLSELKTHRELFEWARANGIDNAPGFASFKKALLAAGIDYNAIREGVREERKAAREAAITHVVTLYSDAKAKNDRFGITDSAGNPVWFGRFFADDQEYNGEQSSGEMAAAQKAVWLASKIKEAVGADMIRLNLFVDAQWLCYANAVTAGESGGGKARPLGYLAQKLGIVLDVQWVPGTKNPADAFTICDGYKKWSDNDLAVLAVPVEKRVAADVTENKSSPSP